MTEDFSVRSPRRTQWHEPHGERTALWKGGKHRAEVLYSANSVVAPSQTPLEGRDKTFSSIPRRNRREVLINKQHMLILQWWEIQVDNF